MTYLGAINFTGNKQDLLSVLYRHFPESDRFVDAFCGGLSVSLNVNNTVVANDSCKPLIDMYRAMMDTTANEVLDLVLEYGLNKSNVLGYNNLKAKYNTTRDPILLFLLHMHSYSNIIRFNNEGEFNASFGKRSINNSIMRKFTHFKMNCHKLQFSSESFEDLAIKDGDFVYADPPYLISEAAYNANWDMHKELKLLEWLDSLDKRGIKFGLSNVIRHKKKENSLIIDWMDKYNVVDLNKQYILGTRSINRKTQTQEVYIHN